MGKIYYPHIYIDDNGYTVEEIREAEERTLFWYIKKFFKKITGIKNV